MSEMPRRVAITYGDDRFRTQRDKFAAEVCALQMFHIMQVYTPETLAPDFMQFLAPFTQLRANAFCLWKPYICIDAARKMVDGEFLVYMDSGCSIRQECGGRFEHYFEVARSSPTGILAFQMGHLLERDWTKADTFAHLGLALDGPEANSGQLIGTAFVVFLNPRSRKLLREWYATALQHSHLFTDAPSTIPNASGFKENRHDQSLWSLLNKKAGSTIIPDETSGPNAQVVLATRRHG